jgi:outer membrane murein-binding lipoprotein Lpp
MLITVCHVLTSYPQLKLSRLICVYAHILPIPNAPVVGLGGLACGSGGNRWCMKRALMSGAVVLSVLSLIGCGSDGVIESAASDVGNAAGEVTDDAAGVAARNIATQQGEEQFKNAGHELDGPLTCTSEVLQDAGSIKIDCTGTAKSGGAVVLRGTTNELPGASVVMLEGLFVGTVDDVEVFSTETLGG